MYIYVKHFEQQTVRTYGYHEFPYKLSTNLPSKKEWSQFIRSVDFEHTYLLCPTYEVADRTPDYQVCVTGRPIRGEHIVDTYDRELGEELGLSILDKNNNIRISGQYTKYSCIHLTNTIPVKKTGLPKTTPDTNEFRISLFVYGDLETVQTYCNTNIVRLHDPKEHAALKMVSIIPLPYLYTQMYNQN